MLNVLITNNHIINKDKLDNNIMIRIEEENEIRNIDLKYRIKYTREDYDITIIEIKEEDNIKNYIELDNIIINDIINDKNKNVDYLDKTVYIIQYPKGELSVSYGVINKIQEDKKFNFTHKCNTQMVHQVRQY